MKRIYVLCFFSLNLPSLNKQPSIIFITSIDCISAKSFLSKLGVCVYQVQCMCVYLWKILLFKQLCISLCVCAVGCIYCAHFRMTPTQI